MKMNKDLEENKDFPKPSLFMAAIVVARVSLCHTCVRTLNCPLVL
jgi:hypothetical protein